MQDITQIVPLAGGTVVLRAWGAHQTDALFLDLMAVTATLGQMREDAIDDVDNHDIEHRTWASYMRLLQASVDGCALPATTFTERMLLLEVMWHLNDMEAGLGKLAALRARALARIQHLTSQGQTTT